MAKRKGKGKYTFLEAGEMPRAKASILFSAGSLAILAGTMLASWGFQGKAGLLLGAIGLVGALFAAYAFIIAMIAMTRRQSRYYVCVAAVVFSGLMAIVWLTVFLSGLQT